MAIQTLDRKVQISPYQTYEEPIFLYAGRDAGKDGFVFRISNNAAVKIPKTSYRRRIGHEMIIARILYEAGISVPKPLAWDYVRINKIPLDYVRMDPLSEPGKGFIMEYVPGKNGYWLDGHDNERALIKAEEEIQKAEENGFSSLDWTARGNYILTPSEDIVLIDFADWTHPDVPDYVDPESVFAEAGK